MEITRAVVIRSPNRRKTISASLQGGVLTIRLPDRLSEEDERRWVRRLRQRFERRLQAEATDDNANLVRRARWLNQRYFDGTLSWRSIRYVANQRTKYGSCSPKSRTIRISNRVRGLPPFVLDYVIFHELCHLREPNHSRRFWVLVRRFPRAELAIGFLMGLGLVAPTDRADGELSNYVRSGPRERVARSTARVCASSRIRR